ncbi:MAG: hypothetical protein AAF621_07715 [Pseudomonadota bacterium]
MLTLNNALGFGAVLTSSYAVTVPAYALTYHNDYPIEYAYDGVNPSGDAQIKTSNRM